MEIDCTGGAGCEYGYCRKVVDLLDLTGPDFFPHKNLGRFRCDGTYAMEPDEIIDLERMNFLGWYRTATLKDLAIARKNNAAKLDELKKKYAKEIELMDIVGRWTC